MEEAQKAVKSNSIFLYMLKPPSFLTNRYKENRLVPDNTVRMVTSKRHKTDKKHLTCGASFSVIFWVLKIIIPLHPSPFRDFSRFFSYVDYCMSNVHRSFCSFFGFGSNPPECLSLDRALNFQIHLGI